MTPTPVPIPPDMIALLRAVVAQVHADAPSGLVSRKLIQLATRLGQALPPETTR